MKINHNTVVAFLTQLVIAFPLVLHGQSQRFEDVYLGVDELCGIGFPQPGEMVIAHRCGILRFDTDTQDWRLHNFPDSACCGVQAMEFSGNLGIVVEGCRIHRSTDGGRSWDVVYKHLGGGLAVEFVDSSTIVVSGSSSRAVRSTDGGQTWRSVHIRGFHLRDIDFYDEQQGIVVTNSGNVNTSFDGGASWKDTAGTFIGYDVEHPPYMSAVSYVGRDTCVAVTAEGYIFRSEDNGVTWRIVWSDSSRTDTDHVSLKDVEFADGRHGVAVGDNRTILITTDGGYTWHSEFLSTRRVRTLRKVAFVSDKEVVVVGDLGLILRKTFDW